MVRRQHLFCLSTALLVALSAASPALAVVRRDDRPDSAYRALGNASAFASVGRVEIDYGSGFQAIGTATLFGRDRLVSAAHVFDTEALDGAIGVRINFGNARIRNIDFLNPGVVNIHPGYNSFSLQNDVSVVFLPQAMTIAPAPIYTGARLRLDRPITFVGYGNTGTGLTGSRSFSSLKRAGENAVGRYISGGTGFEIDFDAPGTKRYNAFGSATPRQLEGLLGAGDSGGSAWAKVNNRWQLVGINSFGLDRRNDGNEDGYGDLSGFVYLPRYATWVQSLAQPLMRSVEPMGLAAVPEPGTLGLAALGGAFLLWRRRTRR